MQTYIFHNKVNNIWLKVSWEYDQYVELWIVKMLQYVCKTQLI